MGIIDPEQLLEGALSFFIHPPPFPAMRGAGAMNQLAVVHQNPAKDASQMKFSPSRETLSPFVFIILTRLFKELSSPASPTRLRCLSHPSHRRHLFGAHPGRGAAMCFSHSSLPQKMCRRVGGDEERHFLTKINRHLPSLLYIYLQRGRRGSDSVQLCFGAFLHLTAPQQDLPEASNMWKGCFPLSFFLPTHYLLFRKRLHPAGGRVIMQGNGEYVNHRRHEYSTQLARFNRTTNLFVL